MYRRKRNSSTPGIVWCQIWTVDEIHTFFNIPKLWRLLRDSVRQIQQTSVVLSDEMKALSGKHQASFVISKTDRNRLAIQDIETSVYKKHDRVPFRRSRANQTHIQPKSFELPVLVREFTIVKIIFERSELVNLLLNIARHCLIWSDYTNARKSFFVGLLLCGISSQPHSCILIEIVVPIVRSNKKWILVSPGARKWSKQKSSYEVCTLGMHIDSRASQRYLNTCGCVSIGFDHIQT